MEIQMNGNTLRGNVSELVQFVKEYEQKVTAVSKTQPVLGNKLTKRKGSRKGRRNYTSTEKQTVKKLFKQGLTDEEIAEKLERTPNSISRQRCIIGAVKFRKGKGRRRYHKPWTSDEDATIKKMVAANTTFGSIAKELGRTAVAVKQRYRKELSQNAKLRALSKLKKNASKPKKKGVRAGTKLRGWTKTEDTFVLKEMRLGRKARQIAQVLTRRTLSAVMQRMERIKKGKVQVSEPNNDSKAVVGSKTEAYGGDVRTKLPAAESVSNDSFSY